MGGLCLASSHASVSKKEEGLVDGARRNIGSDAFGDWSPVVIRPLIRSASAAAALTTGRSVQSQFVGGVAQWLGRRSLAGGLSLTCAQSTVDRGPLCG